MDTTSTCESENNDQFRSRTGRSWDDETRALVFTYASQKMAEPEIRSRTGVSVSTIRLWKKKWSLDTEALPTLPRGSRSGSGRRGGRAYDAETRSRVLTYLADGIPMQQVSDTTGVSIGTISNWKKEEALLPTKPSMGLAWSLETRARVYRLMALGTPLPEINELTGVPLGTIYRWKKEDAEAASADP